MSNNIQRHTQEEGVMPDKMREMFMKASDVSLSNEEKAAGIEALKAFMSSAGAEAAKGSDSKDAERIPSPYALNFISVFFAGKQKTMYALIAACFAFAFVTGTAYAAGSSLPGDLLYPIKIGINEPVQRALAVGVEAKARVAVAQASERLNEAAELAAAGKINQENEGSINEGISKSADEVHRSAIALTASGKTEIALKTQADYDQHLEAFRESVAKAGISGAAFALAMSGDIESSSSDSAAPGKIVAAARMKAAEDGHHEMPQSREFAPAAVALKKSAPVMMMSAAFQASEPAASTSATSTATSSASTTAAEHDEHSVAASATSSGSSSLSGSSFNASGAAGAAVEVSIPAAAASVVPVPLPAVQVNTITNTTSGLGI